MAKDQVKLQSFPHPRAQTQTRKRLWLPVVGVFVFGFALYWTGSHLAGNCTSLNDVFSYCPID